MRFWTWRPSGSRYFAYQVARRTPSRRKTWRAFRSAPDRIRTCDLRFGSALFAGISGLTGPDLVKLGSPRKNHIRRLGDKIRDKVVLGSERKGRCIDLAAGVASHMERRKALHQDGPDERQAAVLAGEAPHHLRAAFDLAERAFEQVGPAPPPAAGWFYSYWRAWSTSRRDARRAGAIAATSPATNAAPTNTARLATGIAKASPWSDSARVTMAARNRPTGRPRPAPMRAVMVLSWRTMRRTWRRLIPIARSMPSSRVRSNTARIRVLTIPNRLTTIDSARST